MMDVFVAIRTRLAYNDPRIEVLGAYRSKEEAAARLAETPKSTTGKDFDDDDDDDDYDDLSLREKAGDRNAMLTPTVLGAKFAELTKKRGVLHRRVPAGTRTLWASLWEPSAIVEGTCPTIAIFTTKAEANEDARRKLQYSLSEQRDCFEDDAGCWEKAGYEGGGPGDDLDAHLFPAVAVSALKPANFPKTRRTKAFGKVGNERGDQRYTSFWYDKRLYGGLIRS